MNVSGNRKVVLTLAGRRDEGLERRRNVGRVQGDVALILDVEGAAPGGAQGKGIALVEHPQVEGQGVAGRAVEGGGNIARPVGADLGQADEIEGELGHDVRNAAADGEVVGDQVRDGRIDEDGLHLVGRAEIAQGIILGPFRPQPVRGEDADPGRELRAELMRQVEVRSQERLVDLIHLREPRVGEVGQGQGAHGLDDRAAEGDVRASEHGHPRRVMENRRGVGADGHESPRHSHRRGAVLVDQEARSVSEGRDGQEQREAQDESQMLFQMYLLKIEFLF